MSSNPAATQPSYLRSAVRAAFAISIFVVGAAGGFGVGHYIDRAYPRSVLLLQPTPIAQVTQSGPVALRGKVTEIFGGKFILQDDSGRALVDTGSRGDAATPVTKDETVTVQGFYDHGFLHADVLTRADGSSEAFGPPGRPRRRGPGKPPGPPFGQPAAPPAP